MYPTASIPVGRTPILPRLVLRFHPIAAGAAYALIVAALHREALASLQGVILGSPFNGGVLAWEFAWAKRILSGTYGPHPFHTGELMFPLGTPVVIVSPLLALASLPLQCVLDALGAYNVLYLADYVAAGAAMYLLAWRVTRSKAGSFLAGFMFMFSHYSLTQHLLGQVPEATILFVPLVALGLWETAGASSRKAPFLLLGSCLGACLSSVYVAFESLGIMLPALSVYAWTRPGLVRDRKTFAAAVILCLLAAALAGTLFYLPALLHAGDLAGGQGFYSLSLLSFLDFPSWHPSACVQDLRRWTSGMPDRRLLESGAFLARPELALKASPENLMGFFGIGTAALLTLGWLRGALKSHGRWLLLCALGIAFSLGPYLQWGYDPGLLPLPYLAFSKLPLLAMFRAPARMILLTWVGICVLSAAAFEGLAGRRHGVWTRSAVLLTFLSVFSWEMGLGSVGKAQFARASDAVARLNADAAPGAVLELPAAINASGEISVNVETYMFNQTRHKRPLVLGRPARYSAASLAFCESTDLVYELTHPQVIRSLYADKKLAGRLSLLRREGMDILRRNGIRFVLFHGRDAFFSESVLRDYSRLLQDTLGPPDLADGDGSLLFKTGPAGSTPRKRGSEGG